MVVQVLITSHSLCFWIHRQWLNKVSLLARWHPAKIWSSISNSNWSDRWWRLRCRVWYRMHPMTRAQWKWSAKQDSSTKASTQCSCKALKMDRQPCWVATSSRWTCLPYSSSNCNSNNTCCNNISYRASQTQRMTCWSCRPSRLGKCTNNLWLMLGNSRLFRRKISKAVKWTWIWEKMVN